MATALNCFSSYTPKNCSKKVKQLFPAQEGAVVVIVAAAARLEVG